MVVLCLRKVTGCGVEGTRQAGGPDLGQVLWEVEISRCV